MKQRSLQSNLRKWCDAKTNENVSCVTYTGIGKHPCKVLLHYCSKISDRHSYNSNNGKSKSPIQVKCYCTHYYYPQGSRKASFLCACCKQCRYSWRCSLVCIRKPDVESYQTNFESKSSYKHGNRQKCKCHHVTSKFCKPYNNLS